MKQVIIVANWKMNLGVQESLNLVRALTKQVLPHRQLTIVLAPTMLSLYPVSLETDRRRFCLAAQNISHEPDGPLTGEVSLSMVKDLVDFVIIGHSERRSHLNEDDEIISQKVVATIRHGLTPIICVGETANQRGGRQLTQVLGNQVRQALHYLTAQEVAKTIIAYEPVWALSDGQNYLKVKTPNPSQIKQVVEIIKDQVYQLYGQVATSQLRLLYGGSTHGSTAPNFLKIEGIDGLLVGGASLKASEFLKILDATSR